MIPPILSTFDRVVVTTTKPDMVGATTLARGRGRAGRTDVVQPPLTDLPIPDLTCWAQHAQQYDWWARQYLVTKQRWEYR